MSRTYRNRKHCWWLTNRDDYINRRVDLYTRMNARRKICGKELYDIDEQIAIAEKEWASYTRDGKLSETTQKSGFKKQAAETVRRKNRKTCHDIMKGEDYDAMDIATVHDGDFALWSWW